MTVSCKRGEIWLVDFNPGRGSEQQGQRPALIIQNDVGNAYAPTTIVAAITTKTKVYPVTVIFSPADSGLPQVSMVNLAQLLTIDKKRLLKKLGALSSAKIDALNQAIKLSLGIA